MEYLGDYGLQIGGRAVSVSPQGITFRKSNELNEKITAARIKNSAYSKVPPIQDESKEDWQNRYKEFIKKEEELRKDETADQFVKRAFEPVVYKDNVNYMYDVLLAIGQSFGFADRLSREAFEDCPVMEVNNFIARVLKKARVPSEFEVETVDYSG